MSIIDESAANVAQAIRLLGGLLSDKQTTFINKLRDVFKDNLYIASTAPSVPTKYLIWLRVTSLETDLFFNYGSEENPIWVSPNKTTKIPGQYGEIYQTTERLNGKIVWAVRYFFGALPNNTTKSASIPSSITNIWGPPQERSIDVTNTYAYQENGNIIPLPWVSGYTRNTSLFSDGYTDSVAMELSNNILRIRTESDRTNWYGIVTLKFTRNDV